MARNCGVGCVGVEGDVGGEECGVCGATPEHRRGRLDPRTGGAWGCKTPLIALSSSLRASEPSSRMRGLLLRCRRGDPEACMGGGFTGLAVGQLSF